MKVESIYDVFKCTLLIYR